MSKYTYEYNPSNNIVTKTDTTTGNTWEYLSRSAPIKPVFAAKNGATVDAIHNAGHSVRVKHLRWAIYRGFPNRMMVVPSTFRKDPNYVFLPKGGYTHVVVKHEDGQYLCVSSECSLDDPFCYAAGVATALDRLSSAELRWLGL